MEKDALKKVLTVVLSLILASLIAAVSGAYIDVQKMKEQNKYIVEDIKEMKGDIKEIHKMVTEMGRKR